MRNQHVIRGNVAVIFVDAPPNTSYSYLEVKVDVADLVTVQAWPGTWYGYVDKDNGLLYIRATKVKETVEGFAQKQPLLHRLLAAAKAGEVTSFKDGDSLNMTRANLVNLKRGETYTPPEPISTKPTTSRRHNS